MVNKNWFQKRLKDLLNMWWCSWCGRHNSVYIIVSMLVLIRFLAFFGKLLQPRKILANFVRLEFNQNRGFCKLNKLTSKVLWFKTWTGHYAVSLVENKQKSKTQIWTHTASPKKSKSVIRWWCFLEKRDTHPTLPNTLSNFISAYLINFSVSTAILQRYFP